MKDGMFFHKSERYTYVVKCSIPFPLSFIAFLTRCYRCLFSLFSFSCLSVSPSLSARLLPPPLPPTHTENSGVHAHVPQNGGLSHRPTLAPLLSCA